VQTAVENKHVSKGKQGGY